MVCELFSFAQECDIPNWYALIIELIIGGTLAGAFFIRQQKQGNRLQKIIDEQEKVKQERKKITMSWLDLHLTRLWSETSYHRALLAKFYGITLENENLSNISDEESSEKWIRMIKEQGMLIGEQIKNLVLTSYDVLNPKLSNQLLSIHTNAVRPFLFDKDHASEDLMDCDNQIDFLESILIEMFGHSKNNIGTVLPNKIYLE